MANISVSHARDLDGRFERRQLQRFDPPDPPAPNATHGQDRERR